jgi:hypothetical protein
MNKRLVLIAYAILVIPMVRPLHAQDGGFGGGDSIDVTGALNGRGGFGRSGFNRGGPIIPDSKSMLSDIRSALNKGKTPIEKSQEMPLKSMLDTELVALTDRIQLLQANRNQNRGAGGDFPQAGFPVNSDGGGAQANNAQPNTLDIEMETLTILKNDDFLDNKLAAVLSPEQLALVQKTKAEDKDNSTCLGGLLDRAASLSQVAGRGNNSFNNRRNGNANGRGNETSNLKSNGQPFCMAAEATATQRLEPIRRVLAKGNLPLSAEKEPLAEAFMKSQIKDLEDAIRAGLAKSYNGNRGGNVVNSRNNNPDLVVQSTTDSIYQKAGTLLNPAQAESLKKWRYKEILDRGGIETLIGVEAMQNTPLNDEQIARVTAAWPEFQSQIQEAAKAAKKKSSTKELDSASTAKVLEMLEPAQVASYESARKYDSEGAAGK